MKYLTKEFFTLKELSDTYKYVIQSKSAETKDEDFYKKCYKRRCAYFVSNARMCDRYTDPAKELRKIEKYVNEENISDAERKFREDCRQAYLRINKERIESGKVYKFDKEHCKRQFEERHSRLINLYSQLPGEIKEKIADIRVFALGYASAEVKRLLRPYCAQLRHTAATVVKKAFAETSDAEKLLSEAIGFNDFGQEPVLSFKEKDGDIYLRCKSGNIIIRNGQITEGQCNPVIPYNAKNPDYPRSIIVAAELHLKKNKFELRLLMNNPDEYETEELWYLTICGTDIIETD